jgi:hypothetical protein
MTLGALLGIVVAASVLFSGVSAAPPVPARIVAVGDVHGDARSLASILERAGLIDSKRRWTGGRTVLVQTGDSLDRGPDVPAVLDFLMSLERQAKEAGGEAIILMGNHEAMNAMGDLRYVPPSAFANFADEKSEKRRESAWRRYARLSDERRRTLTTISDAFPVPPIYRPPTREAWIQAHPPGYIEYRAAFSADGRYGQWIRRRPVVARVGNIVFVHGGLDPNALPKKLDDLNDRARSELSRFDRMRAVMLRDGLALPWFSYSELVEAGRTELLRVAVISGNDRSAVVRHGLAELQEIDEWSVIAENGPLWFRGFASWTQEEGSPLVDRLQQQFGPVRFVVGHTQPASREVTARFDNRVFLIDTGLSAVYDGGRPSALEIQDGRFVALTLEDQKVLDGASMPVPTVDTSVTR